MNKKLLIVQYRTDQTKEHEHSCFNRVYSNTPVEIEYFDAISNEFPEDLSDVGGIIFAGSGEFMLGEGHGEGTWKDKTMKFLDRVVEENIPTLGICFGYQLIAVHQGGKMTNDESMREVSTFEVTKLEPAKNDPLWGSLPEKFDTQFGHKENVINFPDSIEVLCKTERVPVNAYRLKGKNIWGTLSHPELSEEDMHYRIKVFSQYLDGTSLKEVMARYRDTKISEDILLNFAKLVMENE